MDPIRLRALLSAFKADEVGLEQVLRTLDTAELDAGGLVYATVDTPRALRVGQPEVIYGASKTGEQIAGIVAHLRAAGQAALATRVDPEKAALLRERFPEGRWHEMARIFQVGGEFVDRGRGEIAVLCAGTSDLPVAEEAAVVAEALGNRVRRINDVGVAGLHRILRHHEVLRSARVLIVVAGMEGALPSVVAGLTDRPVIAVPTSVGYGASFGGVAALLAMLNSCASGVSVVNIDNGFGAAYQASQINQLP